MRSVSYQRKVGEAFVFPPGKYVTLPRSVATPATALQLGVFQRQAQSTGIILYSRITINILTDRFLPTFLTLKK
jgi:hypothetical protein